MGVSSTRWKATGFNALNEVLSETGLIWECMFHRCWKSQCRKVLMVDAFCWRFQSRQGSARTSVSRLRAGNGCQGAAEASGVWQWCCAGSVVLSNAGIADFGIYLKQMRQYNTLQLPQTLGVCRKASYIQGFCIYYEIVCQLIYVCLSTIHLFMYIWTANLSVWGRLNECTIRNKVRYLNFFLYARRTIILKPFGSQEGSLRI